MVGQTRGGDTGKRRGVSVDHAKLPARTRAFLEHGAPEGQRQAEAFAAAVQLRDAGATEADTSELVEAGAARCRLPASEARAAVRSAYKHPARAPITKRHATNGDKPGKPCVVKRYDYTDAAGVLLYQVERTDPKGFRQRRPDGKGGWIYNLEGVPRTLYRLPTLATSCEIWIAEGEKDCDTLAALGFTATTNSGGAGNWPKDCTAHFTDKRVVILPDADTKGQEHAEDVARALHGVAACVRVLRLPVGVKDVSEYAATFSDTGELAERLALLAEGAATWTPTPAADKPSGLQIVNAFELVSRPIPDADEIVAGILPAKSKAVISGPAKLGKSRFLTGLLLGVATGRDVMGFTIPKARRVLVFQSEVCERSLQKRLQKILAGFPCDETLVRENLLFCNVPLKLTREDHAAAIADAVRQTGAEVVAVDPLYRYHTGDENSVRDLGLAFDPLDALIAEHGVAIVLCHHHGKVKFEGHTTPAHMNRGSSTIADWPDSLLTLTYADMEKGIVRLDFTLRNDAEPPAMAFQRNADTLLFDPLPDYQFDGRKRATKITPLNVTATIGAGRQIAYGRLVESLREKFDASERTAKNAIRDAAEAGAIRKDQETGLYEKV